MTTASTGYAFRDTITTLDELRGVIPARAPGSPDKEIDIIDEHARDYIARASFMLLASSNAAGRCDVSPKGDRPGFVQVLDEHTMVIPDRPGNQRADSLQNIIENPRVGTLFIIPGVEWTLRVNGRATIVRDADVLARCTVNGKAPALGIAVHAEEVYLHCPKCFIRANLWDTEGWMPKDEQPSWASILKDHANIQAIPTEVVEKALAKDEQEGLW